MAVLVRHLANVKRKPEICATTRAPTSGLEPESVEHRRQRRPAQPGAAPQIVRTGETSLEGLTRELLRPALAAWLDTHLPAMVEQMVATEIARIVGKKG